MPAPWGRVLQIQRFMKDSSRLVVVVQWSDLKPGTQLSLATAGFHFMCILVSCVYFHWGHWSTYVAVGKVWFMTLFIHYPLLFPPPTPLTHSPLTDPSSIQAPAQQYALLHSNTTLNCTTTFSQTSDIYITWMKNATNRVSNQIINVDLTHEGHYTCDVYLGHLGGLTITKSVTFYVIGEWWCNDTM